MAPTTLPRQISLAILREMILQIRKVDSEAHMEYRWYEPWDAILNNILRVSSSQNELTVAPQFKVAREAFKDVFDGVLGESEAQNLADASTDVNLSMINLLDQEDSEDAEENRLTREERIPDFMLFHLIASGRRVVLLIEIKPEREAGVEDNASLLMAMNNAYDQVVTQTKFVFERFKNQVTVHALLAVGTAFCYFMFEKDKLPSLPQHVLKHKANSDSMPSRATATAKARGRTSRRSTLKIQQVFTDDAQGFRFSTEFKECIDIVMRSQDLPTPQWGDFQ